MTDKKQILCVILLLFMLFGLFCFDTLKKKNTRQPLKIKSETEHKKEDMVVFNPNSLKFHKENCEWALKCKRCIKVSKEYALKEGGVPCKVCKD